MDRLPDELLLRVFSLLADETWELRQLEIVCRRFHRIGHDPSLWYTLFLRKYPSWGRSIAFSVRSHPLIDWRDFVKHITQQNRRAKSFSLEFVPDETSVEHTRAAARQHKVPQKRKLAAQSSQEQHQDNRKRSILPSSSSSSSSSSSAITTNNAITIPSSPTIANSSSSFSSSPSSSSASSSASPSTSIPSIHIPVEGLDPPLRPWLESSNPTMQMFQDAAQHYPPPFRIQDPLVVDIDRVTKTGIVATGKHRRERIIHGYQGQRSEHKILFWEYPSWRLIREFDLSFAPAETSCQITGIQTIRMNPSSSSPNGKVRLFSLAVGQQLFLNNNQDDMDNDDRVDLWQTVLIYRLFDNGATQCVAHVHMNGQLLGRDVFFFSEASWGRSSDGSDEDYARQAPPQENVSEWMKIVAPEHSDFDPLHTVFMLATGPDFPRVSGCGRLVKFDIRGERDILDPATEPVIWDTHERRFRPLFAPNRNHVAGSINHRFGHVKSSAGAFNYTSSSESIPQQPDIPPAAVIARITMGRKISCMIHFRHPPQLNHLICTGSYVSDQLTLFDWRFGIKVGVLPWKAPSQQQQDDNAPLDDQEARQRHEAQQQETAPPPPPPQQLAQQQQLAQLHQQPAPPQQQQQQQQQHQPINNPQPPDDPQDFAFRDMVMQQHMMMLNGEDDDIEDMEDEDQSVVQPWGLSATMVLPSHWSHEEFPIGHEDFAKRGLRLIAVGDNRNDKLEIKVWDISYLLRVDWRPLDMEEVNSDINLSGKDHTRDFFWWKQGTPRLKRLAFRMTQEPEPLLLMGRTGVQRLAEQNDDAQHTQIQLPYMPPKDTDPMIIAHVFDKEDTIDMPVRYTAYNVLRTSLFLLTEEGKITVVDIETGDLIGTVENVAATPGMIGHTRQIRGIDVNVVGNDEIVVTSRQGLLRGTMI
ncbi:hypothetical protein O0I10_000079 [Lichtheimia ornata]|uniref:F-box domain-containing protein n=1 Tax=Lichtheimia ornata TaxID=688661 RepID=A0AAD7Y4U5_9FUNG|nr:uncharacterized protein O0I10_000079 [Lichtheimia ornata]KAJ8663805.1 hypothetical protein O0I10_000079 [Lichtheimia ornata]